MEAFRHLQSAPLPFESLAAVRSGTSTVSVRMAGEQAAVERAVAHPVSGNYFSTMGVSAAMGRTLQPDDDRPAASPVGWTSLKEKQPAGGASRVRAGPRTSPDSESDSQTNHPHEPRGSPD